MARDGTRHQTTHLTKREMVCEKGRGADGELFQLALAIVLDIKRFLDADYAVLDSNLFQYARVDQGLGWRNVATPRTSFLAEVIVTAAACCARMAAITKAVARLALPAILWRAPDQRSCGWLVVLHRCSDHYKDCF